MLKCITLRHHLDCELILSFSLHRGTILTMHVHASIINEALIPQNLYKTLMLT